MARSREMKRCLARDQAPRLQPQTKPLLMLGLEGVEAADLSDLLQAVADGMPVRIELGRSLGEAFVVLEEDGERPGELGAVRFIIAIDGPDGVLIQGLISPGSRL